MRKILYLFLILCLSPGCEKRPADVAQPRKVAVWRVGGDAPANPARYAGEVRARMETPLAFRVSGKISRRLALLGTKARKGDLLAELDAADYRLAVTALRAQLAAAAAEAEFNRAEWGRREDLYAQQLISAAELEKFSLAATAAAERRAALAAQLAQAENQLHYTELRAEQDGVVTELAFETGQLVAPGQTVLKLAQGMEREVRIYIPEQAINGIALKQKAAVKFWADGLPPAKGEIREIAAAADPATRTYEVRIGLGPTDARVRLGMSATVELPPASADSALVPLAAVFSSPQQPALSQVWLVDETEHTVHATEVRLGAAAERERVAVSGLHGGQLIVAAGAHYVAEGQTVRYDATGAAAE